MDDIDSKSQEQAKDQSTTTDRLAGLSRADRIAAMRGTLKGRHVSEHIEYLSKNDAGARHRFLLGLKEQCKEE